MKKILALSLIILMLLTSILSSCGEISENSSNAKSEISDTTPDEKSPVEESTSSNENISGESTSLIASESEVSESSQNSESSEESSDISDESSEFSETSEKSDSELPDSVINNIPEIYHERVKSVVEYWQYNYDALKRHYREFTYDWGYADDISRMGKGGLSPEDFDRCLNDCLKLPDEEQTRLPIIYYLIINMPLAKEDFIEHNDRRRLMDWGPNFTPYYYDAEIEMFYGNHTDEEIMQYFMMPASFYYDGSLYTIYKLLETFTNDQLKEMAKDTNLLEYLYGIYGFYLWWYPNYPYNGLAASDIYDVISSIEEP